MFVSQVPEETVPFERSKSIDWGREKGEEKKNENENKNGMRTREMKIYWREKSIFQHCLVLISICSFALHSVSLSANKWHT